MNDSEKTWFDNFICLLFSISKIWFRTIYNFRFDDWQLIEWQWVLNSNFFIIFYFFISYIEIDELIEKKIKREKRHNRDRIEYIKFRNFRFFTFHFIFTFTIFNVQLNQITISENIFDTIQFFMRRKFLTINNIELMIWMNLFFN